MRVDKRSWRRPASAASRSWSIGSSVCLLGLYLLGALNPASAEERRTDEIALDIQGCSADTVNQLNSTLARLPKGLTHGAAAKIHIRCVSEAIPFGFRLLEDAPTISLALGRLAPIRERRAQYRLEHLSEDEQASLWHNRGLIHALMLLRAQESSWHLDHRFRRANGWEQEGLVAENRDPWGYSRSQGELSALDDLVTFSEEWFVRPQRRRRVPDNRVECQSFTKGRFLTQLFYPERPDQPPAKCVQFWSWSNSYPGMDIIFTSPTHAPVSSFGHLAILLRSTAAVEPEYLDPVYQYVGLVSMGEGVHSFVDFIQDDIPLVLHPEPFLNFERQNRFREDRRVYRYPVQLKAEELTWAKARLWEHTRRMHLVYKFATSNCAERVLRLFDFLSPQETLHQPGITTSPMGVLSALTQAQRLGVRPLVQPSLTVELDQMEERLRSDDLHKQVAGRRPPKLGPISSEVYADWRRFLGQVADDELEILPYLHAAQDYYDLAGWRAQRQPTHSVPIRGIELLAFKQALFHEERYAQEVSKLVAEWVQAQGGGPAQEAGETPSRVSVLTDQVVELIGEKIQEIGLDATVDSTAASSTRVLETEPPSLPWGSDGALSLNLAHEARESTYRAKLVGALYHERQGVYRSHLNPPSRDLEILALSLAADNQRNIEVTLTPISLHGRRGTFGLSRLGGLFDTRVGVSGQLFRAEGAVGSSVQLLDWRNHRGDLSVGLRFEGTVGNEDQTQMNAPYFASITIPISKGVVARGGVAQSLFQTNKAKVERSEKVTLEFGLPYGANHTLTFISSCRHEVLSRAGDSIEFEMGFRIQ